MILNVLQIASVAVAAICLYGFRAGLRRRNAQSWDSLVAKLQLNGSTHRLGDRSVWNGDMNVTPAETWQLIRGAQGLWTMFENASVMLEMANYAARNGDRVDRELLVTLRRDAMQIRISVLSALAKYAFSQVNESISTNVSSAVSMYTEMAARTTLILQVNCGNMVPNLVPTI